MVAKYTGKAYILNVANIRNHIDNIIMLFDTGAMKTVIPLNLLTDKSLNENERNVVFYYYLIVDDLCKSALIGDDFISCCKFGHLVNGDIEINGFDEKEYVSKHEQYALTSKEILAALSQKEYFL